MKQNQKINCNGFSLLELLIYMGLLAGVMMVMANLFTIFSSNSASSEAKTEVQQNLQFAMQNIVNGIRNQQDIGSIAINANGDILDLMSSSGEILLRFDAQNGSLKKTSGVLGANCAVSGQCKIGCATPDPDCVAQNLLSSHVSLAASNPPNEPTFKNIAGTIQIKLNISYNNNGKQNYAYQQATQTTISVK